MTYRRKSHPAAVLILRQSTPDRAQLTLWARCLTANFASELPPQDPVSTGDRAREESSSFHPRPARKLVLRRPSASRSSRKKRFGR